MVHPDLGKGIISTTSQYDVEPVDSASRRKGRESVDYVLLIVRLCEEALFNDPRHVSKPTLGCKTDFAVGINRRYQNSEWKVSESPRNVSRIVPIIFCKDNVRSAQVNSFWLGLRHLSDVEELVVPSRHHLLGRSVEYQTTAFPEMFGQHKNRVKNQQVRHNKLTRTESKKEGLVGLSKTIATADEVP